MGKRTKIISFSSLIIIGGLAIAIVFQLPRQKRKHHTDLDESDLMEMVSKHPFWTEHDPKQSPPGPTQIERILSVMTDPQEHGTIYILASGGEIRRQGPWDRHFISIDLDSERRLDRMYALGQLCKKMDEFGGHDDW